MGALEKRCGLADARPNRHRHSAASPRATIPVGQPTPTLEGKPLAGYVEMRQVQAAYIGSGVKILLAFFAR